MSNDIKKLIEFIKSDKDYSSKKIVRFKNDSDEFYIRLNFTYIDITYSEEEINDKIVSSFSLYFMNNANHEVSLYDDEFENIEEVKNFLLKKKEVIFEIDNKFNDISKLIGKI